jgi:hypothetical protein
MMIALTYTVPLFVLAYALAEALRDENNMAPKQPRRSKATTPPVQRSVQSPV